MDFFAVLDKLDPIIHINTVSKIELLLRKVIPFEKVESCPYVDSNAFYYSLTKFVLTYHTPQLIQALAVSRRKSSCELFREELVNHLETVIATIRKIKRKEREAPALQQLHMILSSIRLDSTISDKYDFVYRQNFVGLSRLLVERGISPQNVAVFIDREEHTFRAAADFSFARVKQTDSSGSIHIRVSDHLCGYIGRTLYALSNDANLKEETVTDISQLAKNDIVRKHILSQEWFDLTEKQYELYQLVGKVLILRQPSYWSTMTWSYCDQVVMFYSLLRYMASYGCFEEFRKISPALHAEYFNSACCDELDRVYSNWS